MEGRASQFERMMRHFEPPGGWGMAERSCDHIVQDFICYMKDCGLYPKAHY